jgi:hypothetical protein
MVIQDAPAGVLKVPLIAKSTHRGTDIASAVCTGESADQGTRSRKAESNHHFSPFISRTRDKPIVIADCF